MCGDGHCGGLQGSRGRRPCYRGGPKPSRAIEQRKPGALLLGGNRPHPDPPAMRPRQVTGARHRIEAPRLTQGGRSGPLRPRSRR
ncbi:MAG: hypothetical protein EPN51_16450 [Mycobacterium sp.]|nr:MAG: hypothetical protein EPN51_16450 [Mycobacterium sp.]